VPITEVLPFSFSAKEIWDIMAFSSKTRPQEGQNVAPRVGSVSNSVQPHRLHTALLLLWWW